MLCIYWTVSKLWNLIECAGNPGKRYFEPVWPVREKVKAKRRNHFNMFFVGLVTFYVRTKQLKLPKNCNFYSNFTNASYWVHSSSLITSSVSSSESLYLFALSWSNSFLRASIDFLKASCALRISVSCDWTFVQVGPLWLMLLGVQTCCYCQNILAWHLWGLAEDLVGMWKLSRRVPNYFSRSLQTAETF